MQKMSTPKKIYFYKMTTDNGGAPCVHRRILSLAICKPQIRRTAEEGDLVFGFGGKRLDERLIYAAFVTEKPERGDYYREPRFFTRPDCIYRDVNGFAQRTPQARFHTLHDRPRDVGVRFQRGHVLLSREFRYLGKRGTTSFLDRYPEIRKALQDLTQGHRVHHQSELRKELETLAKELWKLQQVFPVLPSDPDPSRRCNTGSRTVCIR